MKKVLFFLPAIIFTVFILWFASIASIGSVQWTTVPFDLSLILAGVLLSKDILLGGLVGILPAIYLISHGRQTYTGLELPVGLVLIAYYAICVFMVYKKKSTNEQ